MQRPSKICKPLIFGLLTSAVLGFCPAEAATQGTLGATSTGTANISITKSVQAQISDLSDMTLSSWSIGQGAVTLYSNVCIYSSTGGYKVTATGSGSSNAYTIASGSNTMPYSVAWNAGGAGSLASYRHLPDDKCTIDIIFQCQHDKCYLQRWRWCKRHCTCRRQYCQQ